MTGSIAKLVVRSLPIGLWPVADQTAWANVIRPGNRLKRGGTGSHMKTITLEDLARRYGYFLDFLSRQGKLESDLAPAALVTAAHVESFLAELARRVGSVTLYETTFKLRRVSELLDPNADLTWLTEIEKDLDLAKQARPKFGRFVLTERLVEAGLTLTKEAERSSKMPAISTARQFRNGLMVAMLAMHPIRLKNFAALELGRSLISIDGRWWIILSDFETKERRPDERPIDELLLPLVDRYVLQYRTLLECRGKKSAAMWLGTTGNAMTYSGVEATITETTRQTVGIAMAPHMFRTAAASSAAVNDGANLNLGSAILNHRDQKTTEQHYRATSSLHAGKKFQEMIRRIASDY